ncbi:hypothetical protein, partial [Enterococcus faecium]|uniref:hypothetical protein n=1 Tax=Enterococcus faecium TaxID=1352 RepID=UPI001A93952B
RCLFYMFWKIKKMLVSSTNIKKYRAKKVSKPARARRIIVLFLSFFVYLKIETSENFTCS